MSNSSLHDYRIAHPRTASVPTLSQTSGLAMIMARLELKKQALARRQARRARLTEALRSVARQFVALLPRMEAQRPVRVPVLAPAHA